MANTTLPTRVGALLAGLAMFLGGCAISTPFERIKAAAENQAGEKVVLVLTRIVIDTRQRAEFDRQTRRVIDSMPTHPGLVGYSARRELFGDVGWTLSVWESDEARERFGRSAVHQEAIAKSRPATVTVEFKRLTLARKDLPANWEQALKLLDDPEGLRSYWE